MFIEDYRKLQEWDDGYDEGGFLADVLANSYSMGNSPWLSMIPSKGSEIRHWISELGVCFENRLVASIMDGTAKIYVDGERVECEGLWDRWLNMLEYPPHDVEAYLFEFMEGMDDADTADCLLQMWLLDDIVFD